MKEKEPNRYREEEQDEVKSTNDENSTENKEESKVEGNQENIENDELKKMTNSYLRVLADYENFKKRTTEERIKERKYFNQGLFERLITIFDIFDKAVNMNTDDDKLKNFLMGFKMINDNFKQILESEGVKKIDALGKKFDPTYHHAMEVEWDETKEENVILSEMQTGYMFKDRLLRPSLVKVNQKMKGNENNE